MQLQIVEKYNYQNSSGINYYKEKIKAAELSGWEEFAAEVVMDSVPVLPLNIELESSRILSSIWKDIGRGDKTEMGTAVKSLVDKNLLPLIWIREKSNNHQVYMLT